MPYLLVSTLIRLENGPTICGDELADPAIMEALGCKLVQQPGNNFKEWRCPDVPRVVLNKLEDMGYRVIGITGVGQTCVWTLHKPKE
jgi:hypothetical protein